MALTLYHVAGSRSLRVIWLCLELDLPLTIETIDFSPKFRNSEGWRRLVLPEKYRSCATMALRCLNRVQCCSTY